MTTYHYYLDRTICEVLEEMRVCNKTRNYGPLEAAIEEAQLMANRMENAIQKANGIKEIDASYRKAKKQLKEINEKIEKKKK